MHTDVREYIRLCRVKKGNMAEAELASRSPGCRVEDYIY